MRFCGACGTAFSDPAPGPDDQAQPAGEATRLSPPADTMRLDGDPAVAQAEQPAAQTDGFASWYQQQPAPSPAAASNWQPTQTVGPVPPHLPPAPPQAYPPGPQLAPQAYLPGPQLAPPAQTPPAQAPPPGQGNGGRGLFIAVAVVVVLAAGGGAYALANSLGKHTSAQPSPTPTVSAVKPSAAASQPAASPASSAPSSPAPSPTLSLVAVSANLAPNSAQPQVETLLSHYFHGINTHSWAEYSSTLNAQQLASQSQSQFESGYSSTTDSAMTLTSLSAGSSGGQVATVTFTSHQSPADSVDQSACNAWTLNFYLVSQGSGYLIGPAPAGYQPTYSDC